jgi:hypothetical protein
MSEPTALEKHNKLGQVLAEAGFSANDPIMLDWAAVGFELKRIVELKSECHLWRSRYSDVVDRNDELEAGIKSALKFLSPGYGGAARERLHKALYGRTDD